MDLFSRRIVGWTLARNRTTDVTLRALKRAIAARSPKPGLLFHSDRGIEYAARLAEATDIAAEAIGKRFGRGAVDGKIQAHVVTIET